MIGPVQAIGYNDPTMPSPGRGNALIMQSGGPTPVINQSLAGVVREAMEHRQFGELYGAVHGLEGVLGENFLDLRRQSKAAWSRVARTPGAALGSARRKLQPEEVPAVLRTLAERGITYFFPIGGNDSAETAHTLEAAARASGQPLTVIAVPKTVDNDLPETDHCPGYGSAAHHRPRGHGAQRRLAGGLIGPGETGGARPTPRAVPAGEALRRGPLSGKHGGGLQALGLRCGRL